VAGFCVPTYLKLGVHVFGMSYNDLPENMRESFERDLLDDTTMENAAAMFLEAANEDQSYAKSFPDVVEEAMEMLGFEFKISDGEVTIGEI